LQIVAEYNPKRDALLLIDPGQDPHEVEYFTVDTMIHDSGTCIRDTVKQLATAASRLCGPRIHPGEASKARLLRKCCRDRPAHYECVRGEFRTCARKIH